MTDISEAGTGISASAHPGALGAQVDAEAANYNSNQIVAMFETAEQANAARDALKGAGIGGSRIQVMHGSSMDTGARSDD